MITNYLLRLLPQPRLLRVPMHARADEMIE